MPHTHTQHRNILYRLILFSVFAALCVSWPVPAPAQGVTIVSPAEQQREEEPSLPEVVEASLNHLLDAVDGPSRRVQALSVGPLLDWLALGDFPTDELEPAKQNGARGVFHVSDIHAPLDYILKYLYSPDIPNYALMPRVLRMSGWYPGSQFLGAEITPGQALAQAQQPVIFRGREYETITPNTDTGAYYRYDLNRLIIVMEREGRPFLISVSEQPEESDVGRKGAILDEDNWTYFYSGIAGLDRGLIGWMDTFMYYSAYIRVLFEPEPGVTRSAMFSWVRAGWAGMNAVKPTHIRAGTVRSESVIRTLFESGALPEPDDLAAAIAEIDALPNAELYHRMRIYSLAVEAMAPEVEAMDNSDFEDIVEGGQYLDVLSREEQVAALTVEFMKCLLGKPVLVDMCSDRTIVTDQADAGPEDAPEPAAEPDPQPAG